MSVGPILQVSRVHVLIELDSEKRGVYIIDSSTNGCWLNGKKLPQKQSGKVRPSKKCQQCTNSIGYFPDFSSYQWLGCFFLVVLDSLSKHCAQKRKKVPA